MRYVQDLNCGNVGNTWCCLPQQFRCLNNYYDQTMTDFVGKFYASRSLFPYFYGKPGLEFGKMENWNC